MVSLQDLIIYLDELLSSSNMVDYCSNGLQVQGSSPIKSVATAVSASLETIEAAVAQKAQVLIVHHGLFWHKQSHVLSGVKYEKLRLLLKHDMALLAYHLPLDAHQMLGNNWKAARDMGWSDLQPFGFMNKLPIGVKGKFPAMLCQAFKQTLENYYEHPAVCCLAGKESVQTAGLISGGAYRSIDEAVADKLDCFITGNFDEPVWHQAREEKINFFAMGHSATERIGPRALGQHLQEKFGLNCNFIDIPNPF